MLDRLARWTLLSLAALIGAVLLMPTAQAQAPTAADRAAAEAAELWRETEAAVRLAGGLTVQANKAALRDGESLVLTVELPNAGYLNIVSLNPQGVPTVLFPNQVHQDNKVEPGRFTLPTAQMNFEFRAAAPYGPSLVAAFLTSEPVDLFQLGDAARDAAGVIRDRFARWSERGRDLIDTFSTKSFVVEARTSAPMRAGMTTVLACAATGPCGETAAPGTPASEGRASLLDTGLRVLELLTALTPGILLEPEDPTSKGPPARKVYPKGIALTKVSEGFVPRLYHDAARYCTIGYGHLVQKAPCNGREPSEFRRGISEPRGESLLVSDMAIAQRAVERYVKAPLTDGQYAALVDFTFNVGSGNLQRSTLLKVVNAGQHESVPFQMRRWTRAGGQVLRGLVTRRERAIALYFEGKAIPKQAPAGEEMSPLDIRAGEPGN